MIMTLLIAMAAGCASALMFASIMSGALISIILLYLAPLPLMVAGLGWGPLTATFGGIGAAVGLGALFGLPYCMAFVIIVALPAWWLSHLALLGRPSAVSPPATAPTLQWYPLGRILLWIAGFAALTTIAALLTIGSDADVIKSSLREGLLRVFATRDAASLGETEQWIDALISIAPCAAAIVTMLTLVLNLWLAARITAMSGQLRRPWPNLSGTMLPALTIAFLLGAIAVCFTSGLPAMFGQVVTTTLMMAYAFTGLAVMHMLTLALKSRQLWLGCAYAVMVALPWALLAMTALGLADAVFGFRARYLTGKPPPVPVV